MKDEKLTPLPQNIEAEHAVLGSILIDNRFLNKVANILDTEDFYNESHQIIYAAMLDLKKVNKPIDLLILREQLVRNNQLDQVGDSNYLTYLMEIVPVVINVEHYAHLVKEKSIKRNLSICSMDISNKLNTGIIDANKAKETLRKTLENIPNSPSTNLIQFDDSDELIKSDCSSIQFYIENFIPKSSIILITAAPGLYKTWLALYIAKCIATGEACLKNNCERAVVYYFDKENPKSLIVNRLKKVGTNENMKIWGTWNKMDAPNLDGDISAYKELATDGVVMIFDSLIRFHSGDENSSADMSEIMSALRTLSSTGASIIVIHHKGKSESGYRGSSDILAGVDICYTLSKEGQRLKLSCDTKNRFEQEFTKYLNITDSGEQLKFEVVDSPKNKKDETQIAYVQHVFKTINNEGKEATQSNIIKELKTLYGLSNNKARELLISGEGKYWNQIAGGKHNKKIYDLLENHNEGHKFNSGGKGAKSVFQFSNHIPYEKLEN